MTPLLGLAALEAHPSLEVLLAPSPVVALQLNALALPFLCLSAPRQASYRDVDYSPLGNRHVLIWGSDPSFTAVASSCLPDAVVIPNPDPPSPQTHTAIALHRAALVDRLEALRLAAPSESNGHPTSPDPDAPPFLFLGHTYGEFKYLPLGSAQIVSLTAPSHTALNLIQLAPLEWWQNNFSAKNGVSWSAAANSLVQRSYALPIYDPHRIRGRGCWIDTPSSPDHSGPQSSPTPRVIFHAGDRIITPAGPVALHDFRTPYIYERSIAIDPGHAVALSNSEASQLLALCDLFPWATPISSKFLAGWCALAPICGALSWRPHIWVTGASGSGKTTALKDVVDPVLGSFQQKFLGATTEAGIRQSIRADAVPVIFDEAESEHQRGFQRMQGVMELIRQASSETGGLIAKGSATGEAVAFNIRSAFCLFSVGVAASSRPDTSRITVLSLVKRANPEAYERLLSLAALTTKSPSWSAALRSRTRAQIPTILENARHFIAAATAKLGDARAGDQIGMLIAGAYSLTSTRQIDLPFARSWVDQQDWAGFLSEAVDTDENLALSGLTQNPVRVDALNGAPWTTTIGDLIARFYADNRTADEASTAVTVLGMHGIRIDETGIAVSNTHAALRAIYRETPWAGKWKDQLSRVPGAKTGRVMKFSGTCNRCVEIPKMQLVGS